MTMRSSLEQALHLPEGETLRRLEENGLAIANVDTMAQAIHDVYCGIMADHDHPNEKDRAQARRWSTRSEAGFAPVTGYLLGPEPSRRQNSGQVGVLVQKTGNMVADRRGRKSCAVLGMTANRPSLKPAAKHVSIPPAGTPDPGLPR